MREIGKSVLSSIYYNINTVYIFINRMDDMIFDFHIWLNYRHPTMPANRCPLYHVVQQRNRKIYPFIQYIHSLFK